LDKEISFTATLIGTPFYISPEICRKQEYGFKSDIWSLGCVLYEMCERSVPFKSTKNQELFQKIKKGLGF
jgi:NIMA (never in mitosis gene a)-related kinase